MLNVTHIKKWTDEINHIIYNALIGLLCSSSLACLVGLFLGLSLAAPIR